MPSKLGSVKFRKSRTITRKSGHWFISFQTEQELPAPVHSSTKSVVLDIGIAKFVTLSSGERFKTLNAFREHKKHA
ncbi:hypothetical protein [Candidatus Sororendozoicomonas aggregata]|uniref:hypothetical protein n=1 Tax=Candidatus Sororendozoicomonas aggregata TaxID=3073239 RepID=UPI002ED1342E